MKFLFLVHSDKTAKLLTLINTDSLFFSKDVLFFSELEKEFKLS